MMQAEIIASYGGKTYGRPDIAVNALVTELQVFQERVIPNAVKRSMESYLKLIAGRLAARHSTPWPGRNGPGALSKRTGRGINSIRQSVEVSVSLDEIVGRIGGVWYLGVSEYGATIRAKRAKFLTIPLPDAMNSQGVPLKRRARDWQNTFIMKSKRGNLLIFQKRGADIVPLYVLKKSVRIPKRLGMKKELLAYSNLLFKFVEQDVMKEFRLGLR